MHLMRTIPTGPTTTRQEYDVYRLKTPNATSEAHQQMINFYQQVTQEDIDLCNAAQRNLERGVYVSGPLHPFHEEGVLAFQTMIKNILARHVEDEKKAGKKIWPAERESDEGGNSDEICSKILACGDKGDLQW